MNNPKLKYDINYELKSEESNYYNYNNSIVTMFTWL